MNVPKSLVAIILTIVLSTSTLTGCGAIQKLTGLGSKDKQQAQKGEQKQEKPKIGVVLSQEVEENPQIKQGLIDAAKKENLQLVFLKDPKELEQKAKDFKAVILQGGDEKIAAAVKTASKQKLPIISIDQVEGAKVDAVVSPNYYHIGEIQANFLQNKLKEGNIVLLQAANPGAQDVISGIKATLTQTPNLKIVQTFTSPTKTSSPVANCTDYLEKNPGKVQAIVATDSKLALEAIENLKKSNQDKQIVVVGAGTHKAALEKVASGDLTADVDKSPYLQGMYSAKLASQMVKQQTADADSTVSTDMGETPAKLVPVRLVVPENLAQFQKTYNQPAPQEEEEKSADQGKNTSQGGQDKQAGQDKQQASQDKQGKETEKSQGSNSSQSQASGDQAQQKPLPAGVTQVREKIHTEIQREMLSQDGKILGTEKQVKEEVRTLPAALVQAQQEQEAKSAEGAKSDQKSDQKDSKSKEDKSSKSEE